MTNEFDQALSALKSAILGKALTVADSNFRLTSGKQSKFYFDMKNCSCIPEINAMMAAEIQKRVQLASFDYLCGVMLGGLPIATGVSVLSNHKLPVVIVRERSKEHGTKKQIEGIRESSELRGKRVLVIEDVTSTGGSTLTTTEVLRDAGAIVDIAVSIVLRNEAARDRLAESEIRLEYLFFLTDSELQEILSSSGSKGT